MTTEGRQSTAAGPAPDRAEAERLLTLVVRGEPAPWPEGWNSAEIERQVQGDIYYHGLSGRLAQNKQLLRGWPESLLAYVRRLAFAVSLWELRHREILTAVFEQLGEERIPAILLKGSALAYEFYDNPAFRERGDSDLLVERENRERVGAVLENLGFARLGGDGSLPEFSYQECWRKSFADGPPHDIDLHFQPINSPAYSDILSFADAARGSRPLPAFGDHARAPSLPFLLLHACLHRSTHSTAPYFAGDGVYFNSDRMVWLLDIHYLAGAFDDPLWDEFAALALAKGEAMVCLDGLERARDRLGSAVPDAVLATLRAAAARSSNYFRSGQLYKAWSDLRAIPGVAAKGRYAYGRLFPSDRFIRSKYPARERSPLVMLYALRLLELLVPRGAAGRKGSR